MSRDEAIARYAERAAIDPVGLDWYVVFGTFKLAAVIQQIYIRWLRGQTKDERFAALGEGAKRLLTLARSCHCRGVIGRSSSRHCL